jgi:ligand-binding sensor domain-containing protein
MKKILVLTFLLIVVLQTQAQWVEKNDGLYGGSINSLIANGTNLFAGTYRGVFLSSNNGTSWALASYGFPTNTSAAFAVSGTSLFLGTYGNGVFRSTNNGSTWVNVGLTGKTVRSFAVNGSNIFVGLQGEGVFVSTNNGASWMPASTGLPANTNVISLAVSGSNLFAGTYAGGVFFSSNNGANWTPVNIPGLFSGTYVEVFAVSGSKLFAGTREGVYLSSNNGGTWTAVNTGLTNKEVKSLVVSGTNLVAGTYQGIFLSSNDGASWTPISTGMRIDSWVTCLAVNGSNLFAGTDGGGVFRSANDGLSWIAANTNLTATSVYSLAMSGSNLFAGTDGTGVFLSTDNGTSWSAASNGLPITENQNLIWSLASIGANVFAGTGDGVYLSTNNGMSWTTVNTGLPIFNRGVAPLLVSGTNLFAGLWVGDIFLSANNGTSWTAIYNGSWTNGIASLEEIGNNLYATTFGGTSADGGVFLSTNNGASWASVSNGLPSSSSILSLVGSGGNLFAGTNTSGVYLSTNNGASWTAVNSGLPSNATVKSLLVSGSNLFAGTGQGVFLSTNNGMSWMEVNSGLTSPVILSLVVSGSDLIAGTGTNGIWSRPLSDFSKKDQSISFGALEDKTFGDAAFTLNSTSTSGLPVVFSTLSDKLTINTNQATLIKAGRVTITAIQSGDVNYNPALPVDQSFCIKPPKPSISISNNNTDTPTLTSNAPSGNQWYFNGAAINGSVGTNLLATKTGIYKVQTSADDCLSEFSVDYPVIITGDLPNQFKEVMLYPNPVEDYLEISGLTENILDTKLFDMIGQTSFISLEKANDAYRANVQSLSAGIYLLRVQDSITVHQVKFIKK